MYIWVVLAEPRSNEVIGYLVSCGLKVEGMGDHFIIHSPLSTVLAVECDAKITIQTRDALRRYLTEQRIQCYATILMGNDADGTIAWDGCNSLAPEPTNTDAKNTEIDIEVEAPASESKTLFDHLGEDD